MLARSLFSAKYFTVDNWGANPAAAIGTSVIPGASNAEGTYTQVLAALAEDVYFIHIIVGDGATAVAAKNHLLDIGVDPAGGAAYTTKIANIVCGATVPTSNARQQFGFPLFIKAGSTVAVRVQGSNATAGTVRVGIKAYGRLSRPEMFPVGYFSQMLGTITNSNGVSFTPGNAADGTWVSLGTAMDPLWWFNLAYQIDNSIITTEYTYVDLGVGGSGTQRVIQRLQHAGTTNETCGAIIEPRLSWLECYHPVPAGAELWIRGRCNNAPDTGYNGVAIGIGG